MSKYYKEEDLERALIGFVRETGIDEKPYDYAVNVLDNLHVMIVPKIINGVVLKDCDKVIERFLEEHEYGELWEAVRALRDFYDWVTEEER